MKFLNRKMMAETAAEAWKAQYPDLFGWEGKVYEQLVGTSDPDEVERIIGNKTWTSIRCNECEKEVEEVVSFDANEYSEFPSREICKSCLREALELIPTKKVKRRAIPSAKAIINRLKAVASGCSHCDYDEAEGGLIDHCRKCQFNITSLVWEIIQES